MKKPITGTVWRCTDANSDDFRKIGIITDGIVAEDGRVNPDPNGNDDIEITYEDDSTMVMQYGHFLNTHERIKKKASELQGYNIRKEFELMMQLFDHLLPENVIERRDELWKEILRRNQTGGRYE